MNWFVASVAYAQGSAPGPQAGPGGMGPTIVSFLPILVVFVIWYFLLIRPQQKRQQDVRKMQENLQKGDRVVTQAGILGKVVRVHNEIATLDVGGNVQLEFQRSAIIGLAPDPDRGERAEKSEKAARR